MWLSFVLPTNGTVAWSSQVLCEQVILGLLWSHSVFPLARELYRSRTNGAVPCFTWRSLVDKVIGGIFCCEWTQYIVFCESDEILSSEPSFQPLSIHSWMKAWHEDAIFARLVSCGASWSVCFNQRQLIIIIQLCKMYFRRTFTLNVNCVISG